MKKKSESLLTLESQRNPNFEESTQKDVSSPSRFDSLSPFSAQESYDQSHISDITETEQDEDVTVSLSKMSNFYDKTLKKISEQITESGAILTYNVDYSESNLNTIKYSNYNQNGCTKIDLRNNYPSKKFSGFLLNLNEFTPDDQKRVLLNVSNFSRPICKGFILNANKKSIDFFSKLGFELKEKDLDNSIFYLEKNELSKVAALSILDNYSNENKAWFSCDKADTIEDKIAGLQVYPKLKYGSGLLFSYNKPQDVMYHMGTVDFPIDIAFVGSDGKIKKICKNIQPGTLGTFGASDISFVFEVGGESLDKLGVNIGDVVKVTNFSNEDFEKYSSIKDLISEKNLYYRISKFSNVKYNFDNYDIINSKNYFSLPSLHKTAKHIDQPKQTSIYDFDSLIFNENSRIKLFKKFSKNKEEVKVINVKEFLSKFASYKDYNFIPNKLNSFSDFLALNSETNNSARKMIFDLIKSSNNKENIIFVTRNIDNSDILKKLILKRAEEESLINPSLWSSKVMHITNDLSPEEIISCASHNFGGDNFRYISEVNFSKVAGIPIPDKIKNVAKQAYDLLKKSLDGSNEVLEKMQQNNEAFAKIKDKPEQIKTYKGLYQQSCRRNAKRIFDLLSSIKSSLKLMNKIKDISSVTEKIDSLTLSCAQYVESAEEIFSLVEKINEPTIFITKLDELTKKFEKSTEDLENNTNTFIEYISQNILNQKVLSK